MDDRPAHGDPGRPGPSVALHVHGSLTFFLAGHDDLVHVPVDRSRSVKDAFESAGIPHPEVSLVLVDGVSMDFDALVRGGEHVDVVPAEASAQRTAGRCGADRGGGPVASRIRRPPAPARFVCDVHLGRLARRLRQLGLDTWYRTEADDDEIAAVAVAEQRVVLTRDRGLLMRRAVVHGYCPRSDRPRQQLREVVRRYGLADVLAPLSRCTHCNGVLEPVAKADVWEQLPPRTRREHDKFSRCGRCGRVYWPGSHLPALQSLVDDVRSTATCST